MQNAGKTSKKEAIRLLVKTAVQAYAQGIRARYKILDVDIYMQNSDLVSKKEVIQLLVKTAVQTYAQGFQTRHEAEYNNFEGTLNMKIHNVFIAALGTEIQYYTALVRSLDSSLGNMSGLLKSRLFLFKKPPPFLKRCFERVAQRPARNTSFTPLRWGGGSSRNELFNGPRKYVGKTSYEYSRA